MSAPNDSAARGEDESAGGEASPGVVPDSLTGEEAARYWLQHVYQGDNARQLTFRAVVTGMLIGGVMSISNLYVGLKAGWSLGVTVTSCIIAYAVFNTLQRIMPRLAEKPFTILENYTMSSAASAAGYMSSAGLVSAIPALYLTSKTELSAGDIMIWIGAVSVLGVFMAIPLKRQLINIDRLPFPMGIATAETLRSMHSSGAEAISKAKSLFCGAIVGAVVGLWTKLADLLAAISKWFDFAFDKAAFAERYVPHQLPLFPGELGRSLLTRQTFGFETSLFLAAAGAIIGIRVGASLLLGAIIFYGVIGDYLIDNKIIAGEGYGAKGINSWTLWPATSMMVTAGLLSFGLKWRTIVRAFGGLRKIVGVGPSAADDPLARIEVPASWFVVGTLLSGAACIAFGHYRFEIEWHMGVTAVLVTFLLSIVAARATGETDVNPIGAMGKITQLLFGVLVPRNMTTNLMTAGITAGVASHSADLLTDLKSGYLLGGNPRKQTISQLFGVVAGTLFCVPVYMIIVKPEKLTTPDLPAPAAQVWAGVAQVLAEGVKALPKYALEAMVIGGAIGIILALIEEYVPRHQRKWVPSSTALGIAGVIPAFNSISMFLGALAAWLLLKKNPAKAEKHTIPVSSGMIAGETLMSVAILLFFVDGPVMMREIWRHIAAYFSSGG